MNTFTNGPGYERYRGPEPGRPNISNLTAAQLRGGRTKWYRWLGQNSPDGGTVGAYQGGGYYVTGLNRPTHTARVSLAQPVGRHAAPLKVTGICTDSAWPTATCEASA
ncbi:hypothetical protein [Streptomyces rimosus]|uniref:hypothetical protein n=1 Tax=Streptomyces rimosus TaxID=1927 RepID=UPI00067D9577|nr:hypothetical protein [Streptomyces rimosus]